MAGGTGKIVHQMRVAGTTLIDYKTLTGDATVNTTPGAWIELVASLPDTAQFVKLFWHSSQFGANDSSMLLDIGVGANGSEVVKIPNVQVGFAYIVNTGNFRPLRVLALPLAIPSGSRVAARITSLILSDTVLFAADFYGGFAAAQGEPASTIDSLGASGHTGVQLLSGLANAKGLWTEIEDSTPNAYRALAVSLGGDGSMTTGGFFLDIGAGAIASEVALVSDIPFQADGTLEAIAASPDWGVFPLENALASGSRVVARVQSTLAANDDIRVLVHGIK